LGRFDPFASPGERPLFAHCRRPHPADSVEKPYRWSALRISVGDFCRGRCAPTRALLKLVIEIEAEASGSFADGEVGIVRDNARQLKFKCESTGFAE
jgi:hypothetical protein